MNEAVRPVAMTREHLRAVVQIHIAGFPGFFLTSLGSRFLSLYYGGICKDPAGIAFVCVDAGGNPVGFVVGSSNPRGFYSRLLKRDWWRFALASLGALVRKPSSVRRIVRGLAHPVRNPIGADVAGLFSLCVHPQSQGTGAGKILVVAFLQEAVRRGCKKVFLTTDRDHNTAVNVFYQKMNFRLERQYVTPEGRHMNEYWTSLK